MAKIINNEEELSELERGEKSPSSPVSEAAATQALQEKTSKIFAAVAFYWVISLSITFFNKALLISFQYPLFLTWFQLLTAMFFVTLFGHLGKSIPFFSFIPPFQFNLDVARAVAPLTFCYIGMLSFTNMTLEGVHISFYQILRSLVIPFNIIMSYFMLNIKTSPKALGASFVVVMGFACGSFGEVNFSWHGFVYGIMSSVFLCLYSVYVKKVLPAVDDNTWRLLSYNTLMSLPLLGAVVCCTSEFTGVSQYASKQATPGFWFLMVVAGFMGFFMNMAYFWQIKYTTPLTNHISGNSKSAFQTILSIAIYRNEISPMNGGGILLSILGSALYSKVKYDEMKASEMAAASPK